VQEVGEGPAVFSEIHILKRGADDWDTFFVEGFRQFEGRLTAQLDDDAIRFFEVKNFLDVFPVNRFEIEFIGHIEIGRDRFRIAVNHDGFVAGFFDCHEAVNAAVIELDTLANPVGSGAENDNFLFTGTGDTFVFLIEGRVEIGRLRFKFCGAGIHHFEGTANAQFEATAGNFLFPDAEEPGDLGIGVAALLEFAEEIFRNIFSDIKAEEFFLHFNEAFNLLDEPGVYFSKFLDGFFGYAKAEGIFYPEDTVIADQFESFEDVAGADPFLHIGP